MSELDLGATRPPRRPLRRRHPPPAASCWPRPRRSRSSRRSRPPARSRSTTPRRPNCASGPRRSPTSWPSMDIRSPEFSQEGRRRSPRWATRTCARRRASPTGCSTVRPRWCKAGKGQGRRRRPDPGRRHAGRPAPDRHRPGPEPGRPRAAPRRCSSGCRAATRSSATSPSTSRRRRTSTRSSSRSTSGQDDLRKDNASIETEKANMWTTMGKLSEYNELASALDDAVTQKVTELEAAGRHRRREHAQVRRAVRDPAAAAGHHDADGRVGAGLHGPRPGAQEQRRADQGCRPGADHHHRGAAHGGDRVPGAGPAEAGARPDQRAERDDVQPHRVDVEAAAHPGRRDQPAGGEQHDRRREAAGRVRQRVPDDGRDRHLPRRRPSTAWPRRSPRWRGRSTRAKPYLERTRQREITEGR